MDQIDVTYVLHRFPSLTETFVAGEIQNVQALGVAVRLYSLLSPRTEVVHPTSAALVPQVRYAPEIYSPSLWRAQLHFLVRTPGRYLQLLRNLLAEPASEPSFVLRRLVIFFKGVWVARELKGSPTQLVHTHFAWLSGAACMIISQLLGLPFTVTAHACDIYAYESDLLALITRMADRVVTISDCNKEAILEKSPGLDPRQIEVIHCGIDMEQFQPPGGRPTNQVFQITTVGSLVEKKGHEYLIRACGESKAQGLSFQCVIVGEGQLQKKLQALIQELDLGDKVILVGGQTQAWVLDRLGKSDLFALACVIDKETGDRDGIPVAMMEALAMEVPVVSTPVTGIPELIRHEETGLLVPPEDPIALASAIVRLARDEPLRQKLARNGRALVERQHDIRKNANRLVGLFHQVVEERRV